MNSFKFFFLNEAPKKILSPSDEQVIIDLYKQGLEQKNSDYTNLKKLAELARVSSNTILILLKKHNLRGNVKQGKTIKWGSIESINQKVPPNQVEYIYSLISKRENNIPDGIFAYSPVAICTVMNKYIDNHPELNWYKLKITYNDKNKNTTSGAIQNYINKYEQTILKGKRADYGVRTSDGRVYFKNNPLKVKGTRQLQFGDLENKDPSYNAVMGRDQNIHDSYLQENA